MIRICFEFLLLMDSYPSSNPIVSLTAQSLGKSSLPSFCLTVWSVSDARSWWWPWDWLSCCMVFHGCVGGACDWILYLRSFPWMLADVSEGYERMVRWHLVS